MRKWKMRRYQWSKENQMTLLCTWKMSMMLKSSDESGYLFHKKIPFIVVFVLGTFENREFKEILYIPIVA